MNMTSAMQHSPSSAPLTAEPQLGADAADGPAAHPPMRVCLIVESAGGGTGRHVLDLAEGLIASGDAVTLIHCPMRADPGFTVRANAMPGLSCHGLAMGRSPRPGDLLTAVRLTRLVARLGPFDILHSHSTKAGLIARLIPAQGARRLHTPHAAPGMDPTLPRAVAAALNLTERLLAWRCDRVIAVSDAEARHLRGAGLPARKLATIVNGVDAIAGPADRLDATPMGASALETPTTTQPPLPAHVFGFAGRIVPQKCADRLIRAFAALCRRPLPPHHARPRLVMIGDGPGLPALRRLADDLGAGPQIAWVGAADARCWYRHFDSLVLPSRYEAMPYVLLEAEAAGLPIVATQVAGVAETVAANGLVVPNDDRTALLEQALARCLDPGAHAAMQAAAAERRSLHGLPAMIAATRSAYATARAVLLFTPKASAVHLMHLDALAAHASAAGIATRRVSLPQIARLPRGAALFVQATGLLNLLALPLARLRRARIVLYLHEPTPLSRKLAENPPLKAMVWHVVQLAEARLAQTVMVSRPQLRDEAAGRFAPASRLHVAPLLMPPPYPSAGRQRERNRVLYLGRPDDRRYLAEFATAAPTLRARGFRPTVLTGDPAGLSRLLPVAPPGIDIIARQDFPETLKTSVMAETLCLWNPKRGPIAQSGVTADALRHGVAILLTNGDPAHAALVEAGVALDWHAEAECGFAGLDRLDPDDIARRALRLFDDCHGASAFRRDWLPCLR